MPPKTPDELREQLERQNQDQPAEGKDRTAEGLEVERPSREGFLGNLKKVTEPDDGRAVQEDRRPRRDS
jgi:hypothetical protein